MVLAADKGPLYLYTLEDQCANGGSLCTERSQSKLFVHEACEEHNIVMLQRFKSAPLIHATPLSTLSSRISIFMILYWNLGIVQKAKEILDSIPENESAIRSQFEEPRNVMSL